MNGKGLLIWDDGKKYEGYFVNDKREGRGTFTWPDGRKYIGEWQAGKYHGKGIFVNINGHSKEGYWIHGKKVQHPSNKSSKGVPSFHISDQDSLFDKASQYSHY